jgi:hypothetical protein
LITKAGMTIMLPVDGSQDSSNTSPYTYLNASQTTYNLIFKEDNKEVGTTATSTVDGEHFAATIGITDSKIYVSSLNYTGSTTYEVGDTEKYIQYLESDVATKITYDQSGTQYTAEIEYHGEEAYGNFYVGGEASSVTMTEGAEEGSSSSIRIDVGATLLASEVAGEELTQNMILVGGPCANEATAVVMGAGEDCAAGFEAGKAMIQLFENDGNVAMVVAGYTAADTRAATAVVSNYDQYDLSGEKVEVTTATKTVKQVEVVDVDVDVDADADVDVDVDTDTDADIDVDVNQTTE